MLKCTGGVLVLLASLLAGKYQVKRLRERVHQLRELLTILSCIRSKIQYSMSPLPRIFREISYQASQPWRDIFLRLSQSMERTDRTLAENWQTALLRISEETALKEEDTALLQPLMAGLGDLDKQRSITAVDLVSGQLQLQLKEASLKQEERTRMAVTLSVTAGFFVIVLLL